MTSCLKVERRVAKETRFCFIETNRLQYITLLSMRKVKNKNTGINDFHPRLTKADQGKFKQPLSPSQSPYSSFILRYYYLLSHLMFGSFVRQISLTRLLAAQ